MKEIALRIAQAAFANKRDLGGKPYIDHLVRVAQNAGKNMPDPSEDQKEGLFIIGVLHDLIEDSSGFWTADHIEAIFGVFISDAVFRLTKLKNEEYSSYIERVCNGGPMVRAVKIADLLDNMDLSRLQKVTDKDLQRVKKYHDALIRLGYKK